MEEEQIKLGNSKQIIDEANIFFIEELMVNKENEEYKIKFGIKGDILVIRVSQEKSIKKFYYQKCYTINELQNLSIIFNMYKTLLDIVAFMKKLNFDIEEGNNDLIIKFILFMPDGENKLINLNLEKILLDTNYLINYLLEENKSIKDNIKNLEQKYESEIKDLKTNISNLKEENNKLWEKINQLDGVSKNSNLLENQSIILDEDIDIVIFDSKIVSMKSINFILDYIRENDKSFNFNEIKLLYRGSRDSDNTKTCHELCDNKQNVLIIIKSDTGFIFGGYSKIGFKTYNNQSDWKYLKDKDSFLFSVNLKKVYPCFKNKAVICHIPEKYGLCFNTSLAVRNNFMNENNNNIYPDIKKYFKGFKHKFELNGGNDKFTCIELEVFQLL